jgi:galactose mutarotase-like enzyme
MIKIANDRLSASISPLGAELQSLKLNHNQHELIWQRDPEVWSGSAPILFPIVGRLIEGQYILDGKTYAMPIHGIVRAEPWTVTDHAEDYVTLEISDSETSRQSYPFRWKVVVRFELIGLELVVRYWITNLDTRTMYFSFGSHPAFNLDFGSDQISDYVLRIENDGPALQRHKIVGGKLSKERYDLPWQGSDLPLSDTLLDGGALVFVGLDSQKVVLLSTQDPRQILFDTGGAPDLGVWRMRGAPYVCLEPWYGYDDPEDHDQQFVTKPGIQTLESLDTFTTSYTIGLNSNWLQEAE